MTKQFCNLERRVLGGGREVIDHPQRANHHDDVCLVVAGCLVALASVTGAEAWCLVYEMWSQGKRVDGSPDPLASDLDPVRPSGDWNFNSAPLIKVVVPEPIASTESGMLGRSFHRMGNEVVVEMSHRRLASGCRGRARGAMPIKRWRGSLAWR
jgi:hypothetical protein